MLQPQNVNNGQAQYASDIIVIATDNAGQSGNATVRFNYISDIVAGMMPPGATVQTASQFQNVMYDLGVPSYGNNINNVCAPSPRRAAQPFPRFLLSCRTILRTGPRCGFKVSHREHTSIHVGKSDVRNTRKWLIAELTLGTCVCAHS